MLSFLQLAPGSCNLCQAEKRITVICKAGQFYKMTTIFAQNDNFVHQGQFLVFFFKAKLKKEGIFSSSIYLFARDILLMKKLEIEETKGPILYLVFSS